MNHGFFKVAAAVPHVTVADCRENAGHIIKQIKEAAYDGVQLIAFPELSLTSYTCGDLFGQRLLLEDAEQEMKRILDETSFSDILCVAGMPVAMGDKMYNCAVVFQSGHVLGVVPKTFLPNYKEFYEKRWFTSASDVCEDNIVLCGESVPFGSHLLFHSGNAVVGVELCEDLWVPIPPSSVHALHGADIIVNLSASNEVIGKHNYLLSLIRQQSARCMSAYIYASAGFGESTTDQVFAGNAVIAENGTILADSGRFSFEPRMAVTEIDLERLLTERRVTGSFSEGRNIYFAEYRKIPFLYPAREDIKLTREIHPLPFVPSLSGELNDRCEEILQIQISGLAKRLLHTRAQTAVIGISGGLDSTLALLVCVKAFDKLALPRKRIIGITMPGFGTTDRTYYNALGLMRSLGVEVREISIRESCEQHFEDIGHDVQVHDITYENSQARERTQILMDVANQTGGLVIGTGDLSELALGWATYNGDHMSMYGVNSGIPKTLVRYLVEWIADNGLEKESREILLDVVNTPISPELIPADEKGNICQKTEDIVGPYELHDFFLYYMVRYGFRPAKIYYLANAAFEGRYPLATIKKWMVVFYRRFFNQQFKRSCLPDGPKVGSVSLSPRGDWRMPSDASSAMWIKECESLPE